MREFLGIVLIGILAFLMITMMIRIVTYEPQRFDPELAHQIPIEQRDKIEKFVDNLSRLEKEYIKHYTEIILDDE